MLNRIRYYISIYRRFGTLSILFLIQSKLKRNKLDDRKISGLKYNVTLSNYTNDVTTLFQIFFAKEYEIANQVPVDFIIDCGANIGLSAIWFANAYPDAKIIAIEPDAKNFHFLQKNAASYHNIYCLNKAIWPIATFVELEDVGTGNWGLRTKTTLSNSSRAIETISIPGVMEQHKIPFIDILKVDIEGAEKEIFSVNYKAWLAKTRIICIELHENIDPDIPKIFYEALSIFKYSEYKNGENIIVQIEG